MYLHVSVHAAVELLSDPCVQVPHIVECVEEGGHVQDLTGQTTQFGKIRIRFHVELVCGRVNVPQ